MARHVPPGRAGRLWLLDRLDAARRGAELLDRKRQLLRREQQRLALLREETARVWEDSCAEADSWALRAGVLGGTAAVNQAAGATVGRAGVDVSWRNTMGVLHPDTATCDLPELEPTEAAAANAAIGPAAAAHRRAIEAASAHAVVSSATLRVGAELRATQRRLRAIERQRIPDMEDSLATLLLRLEELEREERVVARWARLRREESR